MNIVKSVIEFVMDILETIVFIGSLFIVIYLFIMQPNQVKGASMDPSFNSGDYILTSKITYKFNPVKRGDVVVFKSPKNPDIDYIKRVIGLPGDKITIRDKNVFINDVIIDESYIADKTNVWEGGYSKDGIPSTIPDDYIFVMGDNRTRSSDSREFGPVPVSSIIGHVFFRYFPADKTGLIINPWPEKLQSNQSLNINFFINPLTKNFHQSS